MSERKEKKKFVCFMACQPTEVDLKNEKFYAIGFPDLTVWGHTIDRFMQEFYPEDWSEVTKSRLAGTEWGCFHSKTCPDGEIGSNPAGICYAVPAAMFLAARRKGWPEIPFTTTPDPVARVYAQEQGGPLTEIWNSMEGGI